MIKQTFYNLSEEKRQRIVDAIVKEFADSPTEKVSINRIIKVAGISRGSFYQYFDDKVDLVEVLIKTLVDATLDNTYKVLRSTGGDIFSTYEKIFEIIVEFSNDSEKKKILKNLIKSLKVNDSLVSEYIFNRFKGFSHCNDMTQYYSRDNLKFKSDEDVECLSQILSQTLKNALFEFYAKGQEYEKVKSDFLRKLEIIKSGAIIKPMYF